jgi:septum formation protein
MQIVLASTSPYRRELIGRLGLDFICCPPVCDETPQAGESALETACRLARTKARSLATHYPDALIIGSDQVAQLGQRQLGKPASLQHAVDMLLDMSGQTLLFHSALALYNSQTTDLQECVETTRVTLRKLTETQIRRYLQREPDALNCAGAAKSEGLGGALIERVETRDPNALIGVPLFDLVGMLLSQGVEIL